VNANFAYFYGKRAKKKGWLRVSPFYEVREIRNGRREDITAELDAAFFKGYDEQDSASPRAVEHVAVD